MIRKFVHDFCVAAKADGIEKLNFYMQQKLDREISVYRGALEYMERSELNQLFVEGLIDDKCGSVFVENFDTALIPEYLNAMRENAAVTEKAFVPYDLSGLKTAACDNDMFTELDDTIHAMCAASDAACSFDARIDEGVQVHVNETSRRISLADERENFVTDVVEGGRAGVHLVARDGEQVQPGGKGMPFHPNAMPDLESLAVQAAESAVSRFGAGSYATGSFPVVLDSRVVAELLDAFMPAFFARNIHSRMSVLAGRMGEQLAGENISIVEDPYLDGGFSTRTFDDEGTPTQKKAIIDRGVLSCWLHNKATAGEDGVVSGGNGFKNQFSEAVTTGWTNVYIPQGEYTRQELIEMMGQGILITSVSGVFAGARPNSGDFSLISNGFRVENGKIGKAVSQITIAGNFFEMLREVVAVGNDEHWMITGNGNVKTPSMYVRALAISGKE